MANVDDLHQYGLLDKSKMTEDAKKFINSLDASQVQLLKTAYDNKSPRDGAAPSWL